MRIVLRHKQCEQRASNESWNMTEQYFILESNSFHRNEFQKGAADFGFLFSSQVYNWWNQDQWEIQQIEHSLADVRTQLQTHMFLNLSAAGISPKALKWVS